MIPIGTLLEVGGKILDKVIPDPEAKAKAQAALMELQQIDILYGMRQSLSLSRLR